MLEVRLSQKWILLGFRIGINVECAMNKLRKYYGKLNLLMYLENYQRCKYLVFRENPARARLGAWRKFLGNWDRFANVAPFHWMFGFLLLMCRGCQFALPMLYLTDSSTVEIGEWDLTIIYPFRFRLGLACLINPYFANWALIRNIDSSYTIM